MNYETDDTGKFAVQRLWFGETTTEDVLKRYGLKRGTHKWEKAHKILLKSKRQFAEGLSFFTREDIDRKIRAVCMNG